ncbi:membrane protein insertase YidC [Oryzibacter oryziterrae]|uniref:membrane protein insertase YidC n=1 Tax=Oryzibacter oryziterrae TaxID=2766474 RepID=UPI001F0015FE|nr:membrane protein insertase YidC [Oryzibacter oryziterrae]
MSENRNLFLAIALSLAILLGWQYFIAKPQLDKARMAEQAKQEQTVAAGAAGTGAPAAGVDGAVPVAQAFVTRDAAISASARVAIDTPELSGSISLTGARIDDLSLKLFRETIDPNSPLVKLLNPFGTENAYYAEFGFKAPAGDATPVPTSDTVWTAPAGAKLTATTPVTLTWDNGKGLVFSRTISVDPHTMFDVKDSVENKTAAPVTLYPYGLVTRYGEPKDRTAWVLHEGMVGVFGDNGLNETTYANLKKELMVKTDPVSYGWLGITDKYWAAVLIPTGEATFTPKYSFAQAGTIDTFQANYLRDALAVAPGASASTETRLFAGAKTVSRIDAYETELGIDKFDHLIDWGWFYWITKPMFRLIDTLYKYVGNFGIAILLVTLIVKTIFFPLANKSYASMSKMKKIQPEMNELKTKYADDKVKQQQAMMELYKREKINPVAGCLPVALQIPVFFSLYKVLYVTIEMRHAPFFGWIHDLSAADPTTVFNLFGLIPWAPPAMLMLGVWPLIMGVTMFIQMKLNPAPPDPTQAMMFTYMPIIFTFMMASFPAGLVIYWSWNNTLSILQQSFIMKKNGVRIELFDNLKSTFGKKAKAG